VCQPTLHDGRDGRSLLAWRLDPPRPVVASTVLGGGIGHRHWIINAQVPGDYSGSDHEAHLRQLAHQAGLTGPGVGFLTAAPVRDFARGASGNVHVVATVGLGHPTWAAAPATSRPGPPVATINIVAFVPAALSDAAFVDAVVTVTEAKTQALLELTVPGTGTASDAVCIVAANGGPPEPFGGPRSTVGGHVARAVHAAVRAGATTWNSARERLA
jgi:adenosylcobinamide amidohydrolase